MNKGKTMIWSASAMMANAIAARKREPGEIVMVSLATAVLPILLDAYSKPMGRIPDSTRGRLHRGQVHDGCSEPSRPIDNAVIKIRSQRIPSLRRSERNALFPP